MNYFKGQHICKKNDFKKNGFDIVNNSKSEILKGLKEFEKLKTKKKQTKRQKKFKESIPDYMELKLLQTISCSNFYIDNNDLLSSINWNSLQTSINFKN